LEIIFEKQGDFPNGIVADYLFKSLSDIPAFFCVIFTLLNPLRFYLLYLEISRLSVMKQNRNVYKYSHMFSLKIVPLMLVKQPFIKLQWRLYWMSLLS
jgi:hypothetical protein